MSLVSIHIGQCGTTVGSHLHHTLANHLLTPSPSPHASLFFRPPISTTKSNSNSSSTRYVARAILIDTEAKVVKKINQDLKHSVWKYDDRNQYVQKAGAANNWAYGYHSHGPNCYEAIRKSIRREVSLCDNFGGFLIMHSLAGGTGSGLGSYITEQVRRDFPQAFIVNQVVWPYETGEVIVQNYNMVLTLASLYSVSDAVLLMYNDHIQQICLQRLNLKKASFHDMNAVIADILFNIFFPCGKLSMSDFHSNVKRNGKGTGKEKSKTLPTTLFDFIYATAPHPLYKFLTVKYVPQIPTASLAYSTYSWPGLLRHLYQMAFTNHPTDENISWTAPYHRFLSNLLILKGRDVNEITDKDMEKLRDSKLYPAWNFDSVKVWHSMVKDAVKIGASGKGGIGGGGSGLKIEKMAFLVSNGTSILHPLENTLKKAILMYTENAYVHQYYKFGLKKGDFESAFTKIIEGSVTRFKILKFFSGFLPPLQSC